jgi:secreted trypsin-like serine protease
MSGHQLSFLSQSLKKLPASIVICFINTGDECAKIPSWMKSDLASFDRIVNGKTAPSPIPWQVHLRQGSPTDFTFFCGGTIIDAKTILTAARCYATKNLNAANFFITAGIVDRFDDAGQSAFVEEIILHESYTSPTCESTSILCTSPTNDIAILKLKTPLAFNDKVQQACLPDASFVPTGKAVASGWGFTVPSAEETLLPDDRFPKDLQV